VPAGAHSLSTTGWARLPGQILIATPLSPRWSLADADAEEHVHESQRLWPYIQGWATELGLTGLDAIARVSQRPGDINREHEPAAQCRPAGRH
jgi:hypothetical protein